MPTVMRPSGRRGRRGITLLLSVLFAAGSQAGGAPLVEETLQVPVQSTVTAQRPFRQSISVRIVRVPAAGRRPILVLLHGRDGDARQRARLALPIYPANARYFASRGFVVIVPLRIGYGISGGPDIEFTGDCADKRYGEGVEPALRETQQVLAFVRRLPYVDATRGIVVGESFGGLVAIAATANPVPGLLGVVNIEGGDGGDAVQRPDEPCSPDQLRVTLAQYGQTSRLPTLWLYSANDRLWGNRYPREWYAAFRKAGGLGTFTPLPADKNNGHYIFSRNAPAWHPAFENFVASLGLSDRHGPR